MSTTRYGAGSSSSAVAPRNDNRASSSPPSSSGATPSTSAAGPKKSSRLVASRAALVAVARTCSAPRSSRARRYSLQGVDGASDRVGVKAPGGVDALTEPRDAHPPVERSEVRVATGAVHVRDEEAGRVGADVDRRQHAHASRIESLLHPAPDGIVGAGEVVGVVGVQALHPHRGTAHAARRPGTLVRATEGGVALGGVGRVGGGELGGVDRVPRRRALRPHPPAGRRRPTAPGRRASTASASACRRAAAARCGSRPVHPRRCARRPRTRPAAYARAAR